MRQGPREGAPATPDWLVLHPGYEFAEVALRYRLPTISHTGEFTATGGLMSYGGGTEPEDRQGPRPDCPRRVVGRCRSGDPIGGRNVPSGASSPSTPGPTRPARP